ncbi:hypothetical protein [Herbaspirillum sp. RV1423]|uniref:hypothetical protein n=1 Tax=Herbaspirillum sp. RV1423 TaxID=1443993 RepID=UPI000550C8B3|nr:hypothetical protein [Herbaspirillum sp. RV1423]
MKKPATKDLPYPVTEPTALMIEMRKKIEDIEPPVKWNMGTWNFSTWEPDHLHWVAPSTMTLYSDGSIVGTVGHLAVMRRTGWPLDEGIAWWPCVQIDLLDDSDSMLSQITVSFGKIPYKFSVDNVSHTWNAPGIPQHLARISKIKGRRVWEPDGNDSPVIIPITPPIPIP